MKIRDTKIRSAFSRIRKDIDELKLVQESQSASFDTKINNNISTLNERFKSVIDNFKSDYDNSFEEIRDITQELNGTSAKKENVENELKKIQINIDILKKEINDIYENLEDFNERLNLISNKLQEFENLSVDVEDVENNFITKKEVDEIKANIEALYKNNKRLQKSDKKLASIDNRIQDLEQNKYVYVRREQVDKLQEDIIDLKLNLAFKDDLMNMSNRLDALEERQLKRTDNMKADIARLNKNIEDVFQLKKSFVSKEQFKNQRKEIRLLVQGLKDIQKIKAKLDKQKVKPSKKKSGILDSVIDFFSEDESK